jgi:glycosyltransferase involved in cell wall biosynthesis
LRSVYAQTILPDEVIVVDDGSSDATKDILHDFPEIIYIYQKNQGVSSARNRGIEKASYEWIAFLDSDDVWHKEKLEKQKKFHLQNLTCKVSYTDEIWIRNAQEVKIPKKFHKIGKNTFLENSEYCNIAPSSVMIHKSIFDEIGLFDVSFEVCEDYDLWLRIASKHHIELLNEKLLYKYAGEDEQLSFRHWGMDRWRVKALEKYSGDTYIQEVRNILLKKYTLLLKGALKYDKIAFINKYEQKIHNLKDTFETDNSRK